MKTQTQWRPKILSAAELREQAAEWFVRSHNNDLDLVERRALIEWFKSSPVHIAEYLRFEPVHRDLCRALHGARARVGSRPVEMAVDYVAPFTERDSINLVWDICAKASYRDLALWAEDTVPVTPRIQQASGQIVDDVPETTLKLMANIELQRRSKRHERTWWIVGIVATGVASPLIVAAVKMLLAMV